MLRSQQRAAIKEGMLLTTCREGILSRQAAKKLSSQRNLKKRKLPNLWDSVNAVQAASSKRHHDKHSARGLIHVFTASCINHY